MKNETERLNLEEMIALARKVPRWHYSGGPGFTFAILGGSDNIFVEILPKLKKYLLFGKVKYEICVGTLERQIIYTYNFVSPKFGSSLTYDNRVDEIYMRAVKGIDEYRKLEYKGEKQALQREISKIRKAILEGRK